jgi:hypothetical protein
MRQILSGAAPGRTMHPMRRTWLAVAVLLLTGCGTGLFGGDPGPERTQDRTIDAVSQVELATSGDLVLTTGDTPSLRITAGKNVLDGLTSDVRDDRLTLDTRGSVGDLGTVRYELVLPAARTVEVSGSGSAQATSPSGLGKIVVSGSGEVTTEGLATDRLSVELSGSGTVTVDGRAVHQQVQLDGSGEYDAHALDSQDAEVTVSGSGTAEVQVSGTLKAVVEGSGTITYGGGATVDREIDGSGSVEER